MELSTANPRLCSHLSRHRPMPPRLPAAEQEQEQDRRLPAWHAELAPHHSARAPDGRDLDTAISQSSARSHNPVAVETRLRDQEGRGSAGFGRQGQGLALASDSVGLDRPYRRPAGSNDPATGESEAAATSRDQLGAPIGESHRVPFTGRSARAPTQALAAIRPNVRAHRAGRRPRQPFLKRQRLSVADGPSRTVGTDVR